MTPSRSAVWLFGSLLCMALIIAIPICAEAEDDPLRHGHALLIGVWAYTGSQWPRLEEIKLQISQLEKGLASNFDEIEILPNPTFAQLDNGLRGFLRRYGNDPGGRLLIYYAGHGYTELDSMRNEYRGYI